MSGLLTESSARLGVALIHSVWQLGLVAIALATILSLSRSARQRYWVACAGLALMLLLPVSTWLLISTSDELLHLATFGSWGQRSVVESGPPVDAATTLSPPISYNSLEIERSAELTGLVPKATTRSLPFEPTSWLHVVSWWVTCLWALGAVSVSVVSVLRLRQAYQICSQATRDVPGWVTDITSRWVRRLGLSTIVEVAVSARVSVPALVGCLKPVILLPPSILCQVSPEHLELIVAHELAHVRRYDFLVNLIQSTIEALLFYHPCVWWLSSRIREEREYCADDMVLNMDARPDEYVGALLRIESCRHELEPALAVSGGSLARRVRRIADGQVRLRRNDVIGRSVVLPACILGGLLLPPLISATLAQPVPNSENSLSEDSFMSEENVGERWQNAIETEDLSAIRDLLGHPWGNIKIQCLQKFREDGTWFLLDPLCAAAQQGSIQVAELLVEAGVSPNHTNGIAQYNATLNEAHCLAWATSAEMREFLIEKGADPSTLEGTTVPHLNDVSVPRAQTKNNLGERWQAALEALDVDQVRALLKQHPHLVDQPMLGVAGDGRFWICDPLYQVASADGNLHPIKATAEQSTAKLEIAGLLVDAGYDRDRIREATREATTDVANYLLDQVGEGTPDMGLLAYGGQATELQFWIDRGIEVPSGALHNATCGRGRHRGYDTDDHTGWPEAFRDAVRVLIAAGADVNERNAGGGAAYDGCRPYTTYGETPLHFAAGSWDIDVLHQLLEAGADKNVQNEQGETPYDFAVKWEASDEVRALLRPDNLLAETPSGGPAAAASLPTGGNMNESQRQASKPSVIADDAWELFQAASNGDLQTVKRLLKRNPELVHVELWYEFPLHNAVRSGHVDVVHELLAAGSNPGRSSFTYSSWQALLPLAADRGFDAVHRALIDEMQRRFNYSPAYQPLWTAIVAGHVDDVQRIIEGNPDHVHIGDEHGNRALHWAVLARRIPIIELLIDAGADMNAKRADGRSPLYMSIEGDYWFGKSNQHAETPLKEVTDYLLSRGAEYEFAVAVNRNDVERVKSELAKRPELARELDAAQRNPLSHAAGTGNVELARLFLEGGNDPNQAEHCAGRGKALFIASHRHDLDMMRLLLEYGADPNGYVDSSGNCLSIADYESEKREQVLSLLRKHGGTDGVWTLTTPERIEARLADATPFDPDTGMWDGMLRQIFDLDRIDLLEKYVDRFGTESIRRLDPTNGWRIPRSKTMLEKLMEYGLNINARDWYGRSFLHHVVSDEGTDRAGWFLDCGLDIDAIDLQSGTTALGLAAWVGNLEMVDFLLRRGADASLPSNSEWARPLSFAVKQGHQAIVERLRDGNAP